MKLLFIVNDVTRIAPTQTTALLLYEAFSRQHEVLIAGASDLSCDTSGRPFAHARVMADFQPANPPSVAEALSALHALPATYIMLSSCDAIMIRINPARDMRPQQLALLLHLLRISETNGTPVFNSPYGLTRASSKLFLLELPESTRPRTLVSQTAGEIRAFIASLQGPAVIKPLNGTRGKMVFKIASHDDKNIHQIIDAVLQQDAAMVQAYVPGASEGDTRVILLGGEILEIGGKIAAVRRQPGQGDFRSNVHAGGTALPANLTPEMKSTLQTIKGTLIENGLFLVGADMIGNKIIELNCFSPGGLLDASDFEKTDFTAAIMEKISEVVC